MRAAAENDRMQRKQEIRGIVGDYEKRDDAARGLREAQDFDHELDYWVVRQRVSRNWSRSQWELPDTGLVLALANGRRIESSGSLSKAICCAAEGVRVRARSGDEDLSCRRSGGHAQRLRRVVRGWTQSTGRAGV